MGGDEIEGIFGDLNLLKTHSDRRLTRKEFWRRVNYLLVLHFSEQYLTFSQSRAHFLRHSKGRPHRAQIFGGKPFLVFAITRQG